MMNFLQNIFAPIQNCEAVAIELCRFMGIHVTRTTLIREITEHPNYPSLLSVSDALTFNKVGNVALKISLERLSILSVPLIVQVYTANKENVFFVIIYKFSKNNVEWLNPETKKREIIPMKQLNVQYTGFALVIESTEFSGEEDYENKLYEERKKTYLRTAYMCVVPLIVLMVSIYVVLTNGIRNVLFPILFMTLALLGIIVGAMLLFYETEQYNPTLKKICTIGGRANCMAVLHSYGAKIGGIHWSVIGVAYFMGEVLMLLITGIVSHSTLGVAAWLSLLALPYTVYSIYYQGCVIKQWCPLCLIVQLILVLQFLVALIGGFFINIADLSIDVIIPYFILLVLSFLLVYGLLSLLQINKDSKYYFKTLQR